MDVQDTTRGRHNVIKDVVNLGKRANIQCKIWIREGVKMQKRSQDVFIVCARRGAFEAVDSCV